MLAGIETSLEIRFFPIILIGGYPSFSPYSMFAPKSLKALTNIPIGLSFILSEPVKVTSEFGFDA